MDQGGQPENLFPILSDRVLVNGTVIPLTFTGDGKLRWTGKGQGCLTVEKEVLGFSLEGSRIRVKAVVDKRDRICCVRNRGDLVRQSFVFVPLSEDSLTLWSQKLRDYIDSLGRPKRLLIFLNPFGGKKSATKIFLHDVKPYLEDADIQITLIETKHQLHAKEVAKTLDLSKYDGIVCVSGDGILVEVVNGLLEREDWSAAIKMPIGMVPAGTSNGMVKSLLDSAGETCSASNAILAVIRGHKRPLDVATILQGETRFFSVLMLAWGLVADIDIESEKYRWMGSARIDFYFSDGYLDLIITKDCPKLSLLSLMSNMNDGSHVKSPHVTYLKAKAFVLEPGQRVEEPTKGGIIDSDGEVLARGNITYKCDQKALMAYNKLQITVDQGLATLFAPV